MNNIQTLFYDRATGNYYRVVPFGNPPAQTAAQVQQVPAQTEAQVQQVPAQTAAQVQQVTSVPVAATMQTDFRQSNLSPYDIQVMNVQTMQQPVQQSIEELMGEWLAPPYKEVENNGK